MSLASTTTAVTLTGIAALHVGWGAGASFPFTDRESLADVVTGSNAVPGPRDCLAVAGLLLGAAGMVGGVLPIGHMVRRVGVLGVAAVLGGRGLLGITGRTGLIVPWTPSERFNEVDRRYYGPVCLALSGGALLSIRP